MGDVAFAMGHYYFTCATSGMVSKVEYTFGYKRTSSGKPLIFLHHSSLPFPKPKSAPVVNAITQNEVYGLQNKWANAILNISATYKSGGNFKQAALDAAADLYGYGVLSEVLFKPTKAAVHPFRPTGTGAMSYFIGGANVKGGFDEDAGFAHNGGKGWSEVFFDNHDIEIYGDVAFAMGHYYFTCATSGVVSKVEYTFGYKRTSGGKPLIFLHHSSLPFPKPKGAPVVNAITQNEVYGLQNKWANAILNISATYKSGGNFKQAALDAAADLYGYGVLSEGLFKPTKAAVHPFRPTATGALSYFIGGANVEGGFAEDAGFAHNGGRGWSEVFFDNQDIEIYGDVAFAMGHYYFTCATSGMVSKVEYTFGYKRTSSGKP